MQPKDIRLSVGLYIFSLLTQFGASQSNCNYYQELELEKPYYVYNPEYPANYSGKNNCVWRVVSQSPIQLNCNIEIPPSPNCSKDHLSIEFDDKSKKDKNCGFGTFALDGNNVTIRFDSLKSKLGGRFRCSLRSEAKCICGWRKVPRIVGGIETGINMYPSMAGLVDVETRELYCGATIISSEFIITAAHCVKDMYFGRGENRNVSTIGVVIGEHDVTTVSETSSTKVYRISKCTLHPGYKDGTNDNVAICKIFGTITFSAEVGPVCLPFQHKNDIFADATVTVLGWGLMEYGGSTSTVLRETNLKVVPLKQCRQYYSNVNRSNLCTFAPGKGTCQDSGGPILWRNPVTGRLVLIGIISNGIGCASESPEVAVRTGEYIDWIESVTPGVKYCKVE